jgi:hypothetical protein
MLQAGCGLLCLISSLETERNPASALALDLSRGWTCCSSRVARDEL